MSPKRQSRKADVVETVGRPLSLDSLLSDVRKTFNVQLQTFLAQFVENVTSEQLEEFLPEDLGEVDEWVDEHVSAFFKNEEPTVSDMVDGASAVFVMAFLERLFDHLNIGGEDGEEGQEPDDGPEND